MINVAFQDGVVASEHSSITSEFFEASPLRCLPKEQHSDCEHVLPTEGGFNL
jgi:hypothetical protein